MKELIIDAAAMERLTELLTAETNLLALQDKLRAVRARIAENRALTERIKSETAEKLEATRRTMLRIEQQQRENDAFAAKLDARERASNINKEARCRESLARLKNSKTYIAYCASAPPK